METWVIKGYVVSITWEPTKSELAFRRYYYDEDDKGKAVSRE